MNYIRSGKEIFMLYNVLELFANQSYIRLYLGAYFNYEIISHVNRYIYHWFFTFPVYSLPFLLEVQH